MSDPVVTEGMRYAIDAVQQVSTMQPDVARDYLEMLCGAGIHFMRAKFGDEYARGWIDQALADFEQPPLLTLRKPQ